MKKIIFSLFVLLYCITETVSAAEEAKRDSMFWIFHRKDVATYGTITWSAGAMFMEFQWWWRDDYLYKQHSFRIINDGFFYNYSYGVDKLGHLFGSYLIFDLTYDVMKWADVDDNTALWAAIAVPASHAIAIELADGFSKYAFSFADLSFNAAGILYGALQVEYPYLRNFNYKWSYYPSGSGGRNDPDWGPASDYSGHIYWLAVDVHNILPESAKEYWPKYLNLAVGMGAKNVSLGEGVDKKHKFAVALDWNTNAILPDGDTWNIFKGLINKIHFPAPGIKVYPGEKAVVKGLLLN